MSNTDALPNPNSPRRSPALMIGCIIVAVLVVGCLGVFGLLAAIAVPNFVEAQARAKVARTRSDQRMMATALEAYYIDFNAYPPHTRNRDETLLVDTPSASLDPGVPFPRHRSDLRVGGLTTPIAYLTSFPDDPFRTADPQVGFAYYTSGAAWILWSPGPDEKYDIVEPEAFFDPEDGRVIPGSWAAFEFDPTNGAFSAGDVVRYSS